METVSEPSRSQEYLDAQRSAVESVFIARNTLQHAQQQTEQLQRASSIADDTQHSLDKAARMLRGMTWSGWVANKLSRPPAVVHSSVIALSVFNADDIFDNVPSSLQDAVRGYQNYHANLQVLEACETLEQVETCDLVCTSMYQATVTALKAAPTTNSNDESYRQQLQEQLTLLRTRQEEIRKWGSTRLFDSDCGDSDSKHSNQKGNAPNDEQRVTDPLAKMKREQDKHLQFISSNLEELGHIASHLTENIHQSNQIVERLDDQSESILEQTKHVTRRANRLLQDKQWISRSGAPELIGRYAIQHVDSGHYLGNIQGSLYLVPKWNKHICVFDFYRRKGGAQKGNNLVGIKSKADEKWVGQNFFGSLDCGAASFGNRQEWELENDACLEDTTKETDGATAKSTRLLCASAGWGSGGYITVGSAPQYAVTIGGSGV